MSSTEQKKEKIVIHYADAPILAELEVKDLVRDFRKHFADQKAAESKAAEAEKSKKSVGLSLEVAIEAAGADSIIVPGRGRQFTATLVKGSPGEKLSEDKLRDTLSRHGMDAATIATILRKSMEATPAHQSYVLVTVQDKEKI